METSALQTINAQLQITVSSFRALKVNSDTNEHSWHLFLFHSCNTQHEGPWQRTVRGSKHKIQLHVKTPQRQKIYEGMQKFSILTHDIEGTSGYSSVC